jgi:hypothetical protein
MASTAVKITNFVGVRIDLAHYMKDLEEINSLLIRAFLDKYGFKLRHCQAIVRPEDPNFLYIGIEIPLNCPVNIVLGANHTVSKELEWDMNDVTLFTFVDDESDDE